SVCAGEISLLETCPHISFGYAHPHISAWRERIRERGASGAAERPRNGVIIRNSGSLITDAMLAAGGEGPELETQTRGVLVTDGGLKSIDEHVAAQQSGQRGRVSRGRA